MFEYVLIPRFLVLLSKPNTGLSAEAGRLWNRKPVQEKVAFCYMFASVAQCDTHLEGVANPSPSKVQCAFKSLGIALRGIPRHVISKKKSNRILAPPEIRMMQVAYGGIVPSKYGLISGD